MKTNHPRIISIVEVKFGGNGKRANKRYGWNVRYNGRVHGHKLVTITRTTNLRTGALLKKPVQEEQLVEATVSGVISKVLRRRKSLRRLGVAI